MVSDIPYQHISSNANTCFATVVSNTSFLIIEAKHWWSSILGSETSKNASSQLTACIKLNYQFSILYQNNDIVIENKIKSVQPALCCNAYAVCHRIDQRQNNTSDKCKNNDRRIPYSMRSLENTQWENDPYSVLRIYTQNWSQSSKVPCLVIIS